MSMVIDSGTLSQLIWVLCIGFVLGIAVTYPSAKKKGYQEAVEQRNREATAQAFAQYINNIAKGGNYGQSTGQEGS